MEQTGADRAVLERTTAQRRALVVMNPSADDCSASEVRHLLAEKVEPLGWTCDVVPVESLEQLDQAVERSRGGGTDLVIVAGGDGTVARVAGHLVGSKLPLAILPVGKENGLSLDLGIPRDPKDAASLLVEEHDVGAMDALRVGNRYFFLQVGIGTVASDEDEAASDFDEREARKRESFGTRVRRLLGLTARRFTLMIDGRQLHVGAWQVMVVNTGSFGTELLQWGPPIHASDGTAEVVVLRVRSFLSSLQSLKWLLTRGGERRIIVSYRQLHHSIVIATHHSMPVYGDGELVGHTPIRVTVVPEAVKVVVPRAVPVAAVGVSPYPVVARPVARAGWFRAAMMHRLGPLGVLDTVLFLAVSRLPHPRALNRSMQVLAEVMSNGRGWVAGTLGADLSNGRRLEMDALNLVPALWLATLTIEFPIKPVFARPRPFVSMVLAPVGRKPASYSFPSGHSAAAFAGAWLLSRRYPRWARAFYGFATLVAFSRVYLGVHYPSDVVVGSGIGAGLAALYQPILTGLFSRISRLLR